jgi:hypothetical protein
VPFVARSLPYKQKTAPPTPVSTSVPHIHENAAAKARHPTPLCPAHVSADLAALGAAHV